MAVSFKNSGGGGYSAPIKKAAANQQYVGNGHTAPTPIAPKPAPDPRREAIIQMRDIRAPSVAPKPAPKPAPKAPIAPSGKTVGSSKTGAITSIAPPKPVVAAPKGIAPIAPPVVKQPAYWGAEMDNTYQQQEEFARKALADYLAGQTNSQNQYNIENTRNGANLDSQEKDSFDNMHDDFASRGLSASGMALKAYGDQKNDYNKQRDVLLQGALNFGTTASSQLGNFRSQQSIDDLRYRNDAINRHAAGLGLV